MNIEKDADCKVTIDTKEVATKLSFLVGKTIAFRDGRKSDATTATQVLAVRAENLSGRPQVAIYTTVGVETIWSSRQFKDIMVLEDSGTMSSLGTYSDQMGVCF